LGNDDRITHAENTGQTTYRYPWYIRWFFTIPLNISAFVIPIYFVGKFIFRVITKKSLSPEVLLAILFNVVFICVVLILTANFFPEVKADNLGLYVSFLWYRLPVTWQDIIEIKPSFFNLPNRPTTWVVLTRTLTPFHRLYGLLYAFTFHPSFILRYEIENRGDLIEKIAQRRYELSA
jgi:hypothetical protein